MLTHVKWIPDECGCSSEEWQDSTDDQTDSFLQVNLSLLLVLHLEWRLKDYRHTKNVFLISLEISLYYEI